MKIGNLTIEQLSEGLFEIGRDGSIHKLNNRHLKRGRLREPIPRPFGARSIGISNPPVGIDPVLVIKDDMKILLDTGLGIGLDNKGFSNSISNLRTNLEVFGLSPEDITHVVLSHLHYDHVAGITYNNQGLNTQATLPNALCFVQKREWDYALSQFDKPDKQFGVTYELDELYRLVADERFIFIDQDFFKLSEGIDLIWTGGHTPGHQIVRLTSEDDTAYYLGDLVPNDMMLNTGATPLDEDTSRTRQMKLTWLRRAWEEDAELLFYHSVYQKSGKLAKDKYRNYVLQGKGS